MDRRPLKTREQSWAKKVAQELIKYKVKPDQISILGIGCAIGAGIIFLWIKQDVNPFVYFLAAIFIQLRLLCNMLDGMVAVEGNMKSKLGELFNELPDRFEDIIILVCAGYAISNIYPQGILLGWIASVLAVLTAYIRALGGSLGLKQNFCGPMAKPHRMFTMTVGCLLETFTSGHGLYIKFALLIIIVGTVLTSMRRINFLMKELNNK